MAETVIGSVVPSRSGPSSRRRDHAGGPVRPGSVGRRPTVLGRVTSVPHDRAGLGEQIAADLLPEAGDSWAVDGGEGP